MVAKHAPGWQSLVGAETGANVLATKLPVFMYFLDHIYIIVLLS
jgi:hypothetical protein